MKRLATAAAISACIVSAAFLFGADKANPADINIQREVRHELASLSRYTVFDNIAYSVEGTRVTLTGQVTQPVVKDDADSAVRGIAGVTAVNDNIEVLPPSPMDEQLRRAVFASIYGNEELNRYQAAPSIHMIVRNGNVTLVGAVINEMDKDIANIQANRAPGVLHVTNNLRIDSNL